MLDSTQQTSPGPVATDRRAFVLAATGLYAGVMLPVSPAQAESLNIHPEPIMNKPLFAYVGSRTSRERNANGDGITMFRVSEEDGQLTQIQLVGDLVNPSYLTLSVDGTRLYTVHGDESEVSAFAVDRMSGKLTFLNRQSTQGKNPVHLAIDPSGKFLVVTNHIGSSLAVLPLADDGSLQPVSQLVRLSGPIGPHRIEQQQAKPHFNLFSPSGRFVMVPDKGLDRVFSFRFSNGQLTPTEQPFVTTREGAGPRHMVFHPKKSLAYVVNELDSTVTTYRFDSEHGGLAPIHILSTLPATFTGTSHTAGIMIDRAGQTLYASNRGHDSIAVLKIDAESGIPQFIDATLTQGRTPRFFTLSKDERLVYALNEQSDSIVAFKRDAATGRLAPTGFTAKTGSPVCMVFSV